MTNNSRLGSPVVVGLAAVFLMTSPPGRPPVGGTPADSADWDVTHYALRLAVDPAAATVRGSVVIRVRLPGPVVAPLEFDLGRTMTVDSVTSGGGRLAFQHPGDRLLAYLPRDGSVVRQVELTIWYGGRPSRGLLFLRHAGQPAVASYGLPYSARWWWPCRDTPSDKAEEGAEIEIAVPRGLLVGSNGSLLGHADGPGDTEVYRWKETYPIYPDAVSIAIANYEILPRFYHDGADSMPVTFYVYPEDRAKAEVDFSGLLDMMASHVAAFGPYPFRKEKYGIAEFPITSFREHQTLPSYGAGMITGDHQNDWVLAHELAHQWFGNLLTVKNWSHIWLNEGFSTYAFALWREHVGGDTAYRAAIQGLYQPSFDGTVFVKDSLAVGKFFGSTTFSKGAWVLHMLRHVMGDAGFSRALKSYLKEFAYRTVDTDDFQRSCEREYGKSLSWFFREWVYGEGQPGYALSWSAGQPGHIQATVVQRAVAMPFTMPLDLRVSRTGRDTTIVVWDSLPEQHWDLGLTGKVTGIRLDPDNWVLKAPPDTSKVGS